MPEAGLPLDEIDMPTPAVPTAVVNVKATELGEKVARETVVLELHIGSPGFSKPINPEAFVKGARDANPDVQEIVDQIVTDTRPDADPKLLHVSQDILDRTELKEINKLHARFNEWLRLRCIPCPIGLGRGFFLLRLNAVEEVNNAIETFKAQRAVLIDRFGEKYAQLKQDALEQRGQFYNEADYPEWSELRKRWKVESNYLSFNVPAALERVNRELFEAESQKVKLQLADAAEEARTALRESFAGLVTHFSDQLGVDDEGKRKKFHPASLERLKAFIDAFDMKSLTEDNELRGLLDQAKDIISGVDPAELRKDYTVRETLQVAFDNVNTKASELVVARERKFFLRPTEQLGRDLVDVEPVIPPTEA